MAVVVSADAAVDADVDADANVNVVVREPNPCVRTTTK